MVAETLDFGFDSLETAIRNLIIVLAVGFEFYTFLTKGVGTILLGVELAADSFELAPDVVEFIGFFL